MNELLQLFRTVPKDRMRMSHEWLVTVAVAALAVLPTVIWPTGSMSPQGSWAWWPTVLLLGALSMSMATDYHARPLHLRALFVAVCMVFHLGVLLPVFTYLGHGLMGLDTLSPAMAEPCWALVRAYSGFMMLTLGMRTSTIMMRWADRVATPAKAAVPAAAAVEVVEG